VSLSLRRITKKEIAGKRYVDYTSTSSERRSHGTTRECSAFA